MDDHIVRPLVATGFETLRGRAPRADRFAGFAGTAFAATVRVIHRVHGHATNRRTHTAPTHCTGLADLAQAFGEERPLSLCRELSKLHEEVRRTTLGEAVQWYGSNPPKGEFVLVVRGAEPVEEQEATLEDGLARVEVLRAGGASLKDAVKQAARELSVSKNELYDLALGR